jgi:hypothetical protein
VIVKPPALRIPGTCTSSHWPGRNCELSGKLVNRVWVEGWKLRTVMGFRPGSTIGVS